DRRPMAAPRRRRADRRRTAARNAVLCERRRARRRRPDEPGYRIRGTAKHRVKVVDESGAWEWRRFADLRPGDRVPLALDQLVGEPQEVRLPPLSEAYWTGEHHARAPRRMTSELAELVGYFMGDGSLHSRGI